jgi:hypothetical protein
MKFFATIFALAAIAVPSAYAGGTQPMSDVQLSRASRVQQPDLVARYVRTHTAAPVSDVQLSRYGSRPVAAPLVVLQTNSRFDWADFAIGAGATLAAVLLAAAAGLGIRTTRTRLQNA